MTREQVIEKLKAVEHPEIALSLMELSIILDVAVDGNTVKLALAFPKVKVPQEVINAIVSSCSVALKDSGLELQTMLFEMTPEVQEKFFKLARANWKGSI